MILQIKCSGNLHVGWLLLSVWVNFWIFRMSVHCCYHGKDYRVFHFILISGKGMIILRPHTRLKLTWLRYWLMLDFLDGQFNEDCSNTEPCDSSNHLTCTNNKCLCMSTYYHKEEVCHERMCTDLFYIIFPLLYIWM